jgi:hypothetical protein
MKRKWMIYGVVILFALALSWAALAQSVPPPDVQLIARGAGTTMLEGGTGSPDFIPVVTQISFHVERVQGAIIGNFECLALAPSKGTGPSSGQFDTNVMYVTGAIQDVAIDGDTIRISGGSDCTGIGAGTNIPFSCVLRKGGPGSTVVLTGGKDQHVFRETLLYGSFEILGQPTPGALARAPLGTLAKALPSLFLGPRLDGLRSGTHR